MTATVLFGINNLFTVEDEEGRLYLASIKGKKLKTGGETYNALAPGDIVRIEVDAHRGDRAQVTALMPRRNRYARFNEKGRSEQAIAANVDRVILVVSPEDPPFRPRFIDRVEITCRRDGLPLVLVLNKCDLLGEAEMEDEDEEEDVGDESADDEDVDENDDADEEDEDDDDEEEYVDEIAERLELFTSLGITVVRTSVKDGTGISELAGICATGVSVFTGQSGVGKSSLLNSLFPGIGLKIGEICEKYHRGSHTTNVSTMIRTGDHSAVVDTPGFRRFALRGIDAADLAPLFPEFAPYIGKCAFGADCAHVNDSGCALRKAAEECLVHYDRYESYLRMREELLDTREYGPKRRGKPRPWHGKRQANARHAERRDQLEHADGHDGEG